MAFPAPFLDELRNRCSLPDIIGKRVQLRKKGREWEGLCPFHKEKTPSFTVNEEKGFYHCFGCGEHGSAFDFVMKTDGLSFPEAVERLATDAGMQVPQDTPEERHRAQRRNTLQDTCERACQWFERNLRMPEGKAALSYLKDRGLSDETIAKFRLGFAPSGRNLLKGAMARDKVPEELLVESGMLIQPSDQSGTQDIPETPEKRNHEPYDRFRGRVMFPITDRQGQVIAFGGRILGTGEPKYLNSPETPIFHKGSVLYGLGHALPSARKSGNLVVTEGYMDVIALHMAGFENAVAPLGTALTKDHMAALWRVANEPVLCFDGDNAGQRAGNRAAEQCLPVLKPGFGIRFAELPSGEDPDTLVRTRGRQAMQDVLDKALPLSEVLWRQESAHRNLRIPEDRAALQKALGVHANRIEDPTVRSHFLKAFRDRINPPGSWLKSGYRRDRGNYATIPGAEVRPGAKIGYQKHENRARSLKILLAGLVSHPALFDHVGERLGALDFNNSSPNSGPNSSQELDNLRQEVLKTLATESALDFGGLADHLNSSGFAGVLDALHNDRSIGHVYFIRPEAKLADARQGWDEAYGLLLGENLDFEIREAERQFAEEPTPENFQRIRSLKNQEFDASDSELAGV